MWTTVWLGALVGGVVAWVWGAISWMALGWHHATFRSFVNDDAIARAVLEQCPQSGLYGLPSPPKHTPGMTKADRDAQDRIAHARMQAGPVITAIVQRGGFGSVPLAMLRALLIYMAMSGLMTFLLIRATGLDYFEKAFFAAGVGLVAGALCRMTDWNWHGYPTSYTAVCVADHVLCTFFVGLAIAKIA